MSEMDLPDPAELQEKGSKSFTRHVALVTAIYAVLLSITSLGGSNATKDMMLAQQQAADQWAFYQAKNIRGHQTRLVRLQLEREIAARSAQTDRDERADLLLADLAEEEERYDNEKKEIEQKARGLEHERDVNRSKDPY